MGIFYALAQAATFGLIPLFTLPLLMAGITVETVLVYRFGIAALIMTLILLLRKESLRIPLVAFCKITGLSLFYMLAVLFFFDAFSYLPSGMVATLQYQYPVMVLLIMTLFFHERFNWRIGLAMILATGGVAILSLGPTESPLYEAQAQPGTWRIVTGIGLALLAGLCNALYFVCIQVARLPKINDLTLTFYIMLIGTIFCAVNAMACDKLQWISDWRELALAALLSIITAVLSNLMLILAIKMVGSTITSILGVLEPLTAVAIGCLVFGEPFGAHLAIGALLIVSSVLVVIIKPGQAA